MKVKLDKGAILPTRAHDTDAGLDIYSPTNALVSGRGSAVIHTGVHVQLPKGTVGLIMSKSGLNVKKDITSEGVIDEGYSGEIVVKLYNHGWWDYPIDRGDKITQLLVVPVIYEPVELVEKINGGDRGDAGFGSTGR